MIGFKFDSGRLLKKAKARKKAIQKANVQALNRTAAGVRTDAGRNVRDQVNIKVGVIKDRMQAIKASHKKPIAKMKTAGRPMPIIHLKAKQTKAGVSVKVKKTGPRRTIQGAFIATMPEGHKGVYQRTGRKTRSGKPQIKEVFTTNVTQAMRGTAVSRKNLESARTRYAKEFDRAKRFQLSRI